MRPLHFILLGVVIAGGLAGSLLLIPNESDLSLMYFRGRQYTDARRLLEKRLAAGDRSVDVIVPLADICVQSGDIARAVELLRELHTSDAGRLQVFERVAVFQQYGQLMEDYRRTLEEIERIAGSEEGLRELANQYRYADENAKLIPALQTLIARYQGGPIEYLELANLLAHEGRFADAAGMLERFESRHPRDVSADTVELLVSVLLDSGQGSRALQRASRWLEKNRDSGAVVRLVALLRTKGKLDLAGRLLAPFEPVIDGDPALLSEWLQQKVALGRTGEALERLNRLRRKQPLPDELIEPFVDLAIAGGETGLAIEAAEAFGLYRLKPKLLTALAEGALEAGQAATAYHIAAGAGAGFLEAHGLLAARLAYAKGDRSEAQRWLQRAGSDPGLSGAERLAVAGLDASLGRQTEAVAQLARIRIESAPGALLLEAARLYIEAGKPGDAAERFEEIGARNSRGAAGWAWALVAAASGQGREVRRWIEAMPVRSIPEPVVHDLYSLAQEHKQADLALAASQRLFLEHPGDANRLLLANSLIAAGRPVEALYHARSLLPSREPGVEEAYAAALLGAIRGSLAGTAGTFQKELRTFWTAKLGQSTQDERKQLDLIYGLLDLGAWDAALPHLETIAQRRDDLAPLYVETALKAGNRSAAVAFLESQLERTSLSREIREAWLYALIEHGGPAEALPYIRQLAHAGLPNWIAAYEDALQKLGRGGDLLDFWRSRLASPGISPDEKRGIGFKLIDRGQQEWARSVFADLARTAPPEHADVAELLFLWGPKPGKDQVEWLEDRARRAGVAARPGWLSRLLEAGAPERVVAVVSSDLPPAGRGGVLLEMYIRALGGLGEREAIVSAVARETAALNDPGGVRKLALAAREAAGVEAAEPAYQRLLVLDAADPEALHWLAVLAYSHARYSVAEHHLAALLACREGAYDDSFYYAEMLWRRGNRSLARVYYGRALRLIERLPSPPAEARAAHAQALFRSGYLERAFREFRTLIADAPRAGDLRADFAAILLEAGQYDEADDVLSAGVDSGTARMSLLRAQLLSATGRRSDALRAVYNLAGEDPELPSAVGALGLLEQSAGRNRRARSLFDRATSMDPGNEDFRDARASLEHERAGQFRAEGELRRIQGTQSEDLVRISGERLVSDAFRFVFAMDQDRTSIRSVEFADGSTGPFDGIRRRTEAALEWEADEGMRVKGSLFSGNLSLGAGLAMVRPDPKGSTTVRVEFGRPDWDFVESLAQGGVRDRAEVRRETVINSRVSTAIEAAVNRYVLHGVPGAATSIAAAGGIDVKLLRVPQVTLDYYLDGEYRLAGASGTGTVANGSRVLPLLSREVHAASVQVEKQLARGLRVGGAAGVAIDRFGGHAPFWTGNVTYDPVRHIAIRLDFDRRLYTFDSTRTVTSSRIGLFWHF